MHDTWSPRLGEPVVLRLDPELGNGLPVRIVQHTVSAARETPVQKFVYTPRLWASTLAGLAVLLLVSTAFTTGTVRPAPPAVPTLRPGEPTPTPDARPALSFGGFVLQPPVLAASSPTPRPSPVPNPEQSVVQPAVSEETPGEQTAEAQPTPPPCGNLLGLGCRPLPPAPKPVAPRQQRPPQPQTEQPAPPAVESDAEQPAVQEPQPCTNFLGIGCPSNPAPPPAPAEFAPPAPSPAPAADTREQALGLRQSAPVPGSSLDDALRTASIANQNFNRGLAEPPR